jgi:prophage DNA circulation protein
VLAYRLYADASRADEIRAENKVVHPAFCPPTGIALSR